MSSHVHYTTCGEYPARRGNKIKTFLGHDEFFQHFQTRCENASREIWCGISFVDWNLKLPNKQTWWQFLIDLKKKKPSLNIRLLFWRNLASNWSSSSLINGDEKDAHWMQTHELHKYLQCKWDESPSDAHCHHAKYYIIDCEYALMGGITLSGQNYFSFMHDTFMEVTGPSTADVAHNFALRWNHNNRYTKCAVDELCETTAIADEEIMIAAADNCKQAHIANGYKAKHNNTRNGYSAKHNKNENEAETKYDGEVERIRYEKRAFYVIEPRIVKRCYAKLKNLTESGSEFNGKPIQVQKFRDDKGRWKVKICDKKRKRRRRDKDKDKERRGESSPSTDSVNSADSDKDKDGKQKALGAREHHIEAIATSTHGYGYFVPLSRAETGQDERSKDRRVKIGDLVKLRSGRRGRVTHIGVTEFSFGEEIIGIELVSPLDAPHPHGITEKEMEATPNCKNGDSGDEVKQAEDEEAESEKEKEKEKEDGVTVKICWSCAPDLYPGFKHGAQSVFDEYYRIFQHAQSSIYIESQHPGEYELLRMMKRKLESDPHFVVFYLVPIWMCHAVRIEKEKSVKYAENPAAFDKKPRYHDMFTMLASLKQYKNFCLSGVYHPYSSDEQQHSQQQQQQNNSGWSARALWNVTRKLVCNQVPQYVHSKLCVVDGKWFTIGSANMVDLSMKRDHTEMNACVYDQAESMKLLRKLARLHCQCDEMSDEESAGADDLRFEHWNDKQIIGFLSSTAKANVNGLCALDPEQYGTANQAGYFYKTIASRLY